MQVDELSPKPETATHSEAARVHATAAFCIPDHHMMTAAPDGPERSRASGTDHPAAAQRTHDTGTHGDQSAMTRTTVRRDWPSDASTTRARRPGRPRRPACADGAGLLPPSARPPTTRPARDAARHASGHTETPRELVDQYAQGRPATRLGSQAPGGQASSRRTMRRDQLRRRGSLARSDLRRHWHGL